MWNATICHSTSLDTVNRISTSQSSAALDIPLEKKISVESYLCNVKVNMAFKNSRTKLEVATLTQVVADRQLCWTQIKNLRIRASPVTVSRVNRLGEFSPNM
jgi:hypothetical protein